MGCAGVAKFGDLVDLLHERFPILYVYSRPRGKVFETGEATPACLLSPPLWGWLSRQKKHEVIDHRWVQPKLSPKMLADGE